MIRAALRSPARRSKRKRTRAQAGATITVATRRDHPNPQSEDPCDTLSLRLLLSRDGVAAFERSRRHAAELESRVTSLVCADSAPMRCAVGADDDDRWTGARRSSTARCGWACDRGPVERFSDRARGSDAPTPDEAVRASNPFSSAGRARVWTDASTTVSSAGGASRAPASFACEPASATREDGSCTNGGRGPAAFDLAAGSAAAADTAGADAAAAEA
jgi:hypothetical protein